jgi:hypothetical protein
MPQLIETTVYQLGELSEGAKQTARDWYREHGVHDDWHESVYEGVRTRKCTLCPFRANEWGTHAARIELSFRRGLSASGASGAARFQV